MSLEIIAHRGYSKIAPENTLAAFTEAIKYQAKGIEFDVQLSADRIPVIFHDSTLERTTNGQGNLKESTLQQLKKLDAGSWFNVAYQGEKIPTLEETLDLIIPSNLKIYAEFKQANDWQLNDINKLINLITSKNLGDRCIIMSFDSDFLQKVRQQNLNISLGYLVKDITEYQEKLSYVRNKSDLILCQYKILLNNPQIILDTNNLGIKLAGWTIDNPLELEKLVKLGLKSIITNSLL